MNKEYEKKLKLYIKINKDILRVKDKINKCDLKLEKVEAGLSKDKLSLFFSETIESMKISSLMNMKSNYQTILSDNKRNLKKLNDAKLNLQKEIIFDPETELNISVKNVPLFDKVKSDIVYFDDKMYLKEKENAVFNVVEEKAMMQESVESFFECSDMKNLLSKFENKKSSPSKDKDL